MTRLSVLLDLLLETHLNCLCKAPVDIGDGLLDVNGEDTGELVRLFVEHVLHELSILVQSALDPVLNLLLMLKLFLFALDNLLGLDLLDLHSSVEVEHLRDLEVDKPRLETGVTSTISDVVVLAGDRVESEVLELLDNGLVREIKRKDETRLQVDVFEKG